MAVPYSHSQTDQPVGWKGQPAPASAPDGGNGPGHSAAYTFFSDVGSSLYGAAVRSEHFFGSAYDSGVHAAHDLRDKVGRVEDVAKAIWRAEEHYAGPAIKRRIAMDVDELKKAFIPGLLYSLGIVALTTFVGAGVGALLGGILSGGTLAIPAAVGGGELGFDAGLLILDALGIGFLLREVFEAIPKIFEMVKHGVQTAWNAGADHRHSVEDDIDRAARQLADGEAELVNVVLQGVLIWILSKSAVARSGKIAGGIKNLKTPAALASRGGEVMEALKNSPAATRAWLEEAAAQLAAILRRAGKLTEGLADFVQKHVEGILKSVTEDAEKRVPKPRADSGPSKSAPSSPLPSSPKKKIIFSGHGSYDPANGELEVPKGSTFTVYSTHGATISDSLGNVVETSGDTSGVFQKTFAAGDKVPNYTLSAPDGLNVKGSPVTVTKDTNLSSLLKEDMGDCHWAACTWEATSPNADLMYDTDGIANTSLNQWITVYPKP